MSTSSSHRVFLDDLARLARHMLGADVVFVALGGEEAIQSDWVCDGVDDCLRFFEAIKSAPGSQEFGLDGGERGCVAVESLDWAEFRGAAPIVTPRGDAIGVICSFSKDSAPLGRPIDERQMRMLGEFGGSVLAEHQRCMAQVVPAEHLTEAIVRAHETFIRTESDFETFSRLLQDALRLTGATEGLIGEVTYPAGSEEPRLVVKAATDMSWDVESRRLYDAIAEGGMVFDNLSGLLAYPVISGEVVVENEFPESVRRRMPEAHPTLFNYMGIPLFSGADVIGLLALGNEPQGFTKALGEALRPLSNTIGSLIGMHRMTVERRSFERKLRQAAYFDALTGLPNRRLFDQQFERRLRVADTQRETLALCLIDLDGFKEINDRYGHAVGDRVLREVAARLRDLVDGSDVLARLSGDEFALIVPHDPDGARYHRILRSLSAMIAFDDFNLGVSASIGVTLYPDDKTDKEQLLRHADQAMYAAKESGKNRVAFFDLALEEFRQARHRMIADFREALEEGRLVLYLQPRVFLADKAVTGYEALIRWNLEDGRVRTPGEFLPYLMDSAVEIELGQFVLREGVAALQAVQGQLGPAVNLSLNLTANHYLSEYFDEDLGWLSKLPAGLRGSLIFEVVENSVFESLDKAQAVLEQCRALGIRVALDDFGTGYSSLSYLRSLPCDELKVDQSFVARMLEHEEDWHLVEGMVRLGTSLQKTITIEGVETDAQVQRLESMPGLTVQGFLYGRPSPIPDVIARASKPIDASSRPAATR